MADYDIDLDAFNRLSAHHDEDYGLELTELPKSRARAPSHVSRDSLYPGDDGSNASLIHYDSKPLWGWNSKKDGVRVRAVSHTPTTSSHRDKRGRLSGWRFGVTLSACTAFTVLLLNMTLTIWAAVRFKDNMSGGVGTAFTGNCETVNHWATWMHILINVLSSLLLTASNYTMQCLCAPTREEVDRAHAKGDWLDIGVASVRNITRISWRRSSLWWLLALSSIPIHLLYNSAIFKTLDANEYQIAVVNPDFLKGGNFSVYLDVQVYYNTEENVDYSHYFMEDLASVEYVQGLFANESAYANPALVENLTASDCIAAYGTGYLTGRSHVLAVTNTQGNTTNNTVFWEEYVDNNAISGIDGYSSYGWICMDTSGYFYTTAYDKCNAAEQRKSATTWTINKRPIDYCLSWIAPAHCKLQFSVQILVAVILMNACKSLCMVLTLYTQRYSTLVTFGDAIASWLDTPDELTRGRCLMAKVDVHKGPLRWRLRGTKDTPNTKPLPITYYAPLRRRWFGAASIKRWCVTMGLCLTALITAGSLLGAGASSLRGELDDQSVFSLGFGAIDSRAILSTSLPQGGAGGLVCAVLLANCPQAICSFLYLTYNGLLTCMHLCHEYSKFAMGDRRKPLRVTNPHGQQRSTYYLHLPFTYSVPLLIASATLHWLISQSIFLARVDIYANTNNGPLELQQGSSSEVGYSCLPILLVVLLGTCMLLAALGLGCRKFASHIPVAGSCSVALAAAAHRPEDDADAAYLPVRWGEVDSEGTDHVGHACFTSSDMHDLVPGRLYAGMAGGSSAVEIIGEQHRRHRGI